MAAMLVGRRSRTVTAPFAFTPCLLHP
jgi:hypothetical protein